MGPDQITDVEDQLFNLLARCISSEHFQVCSSTVGGYGARVFCLVHSVRAPVAHRGPTLREKRMTVWGIHIDIQAVHTPERSSADRSSTDRSSADRSSADRSSADRSSTDISSADRSSTDRSSTVDSLLPLSDGVQHLYGTDPAQGTSSTVDDAYCSAPTGEHVDDTGQERICSEGSR